MGKGSKRKSRDEDPPALPSHRLLSADELGLLKVTEVPSGSKWEETAAKQRWGQPDKQQGISRLQVYCPDWDPECGLIAAGRCSGRVTFHSPSNPGLELGSFRAAPPATTSGRSDTTTHEVRGLRFAAAEGQRQLLLVTATAGGHLAVHRRPLPLLTEAVGRGGPGAAAAAAAGSREPVVQSWEEVQRLQTIGDLHAMDVSTSGRHVAVGGDGHQLKVWDLAASASGGGAAPEPLFAGKAGKPSRSGLQDLAHVTAVSYIPGAGEQQILVGTAKYKLWLYDMRAGRKPQWELVWSEGRITALLPTSDGQRVWVGNGRGQVEALDLRHAPAKISMGHALKGSAGSIRALALHPTEPVIASVSLDRHLRVHSSAKRSLLTKVYLKQALTGIAWLPVPPPARNEAPEDVDEGEEAAEGCGGAADDDAEEEEGAGVPRAERNGAISLGGNDRKKKHTSERRRSKDGSREEGKAKGKRKDGEKRRKHSGA